jgi:hypothetical protein
MTSKNSNETIVKGTILIAENTHLPEPSTQDSRSIGNGWARVTNSLAFEKKLAAAGWAFFYMAGTIRVNVLGFDRHRMMQTAVKRLLSKVTLQKCNCLQIDHITSGSFCGLPLVTVLAHSRNVQQDSAFCSAGV